jgi:hypothetical protein
MWKEQDTQPEIVTHDAREKFTFSVVTVDLRMVQGVESGGFYRWPRRTPQRVDVGSLVKDLGNVATSL